MNALPDYITVTLPIKAIEPICYNCRFWERAEWHKGGNFGYCQNKALNEIIDSELGDGIECPVREDFGCNHFEVKDG
jgi:hypothetical protein